MADVGGQMPGSLFGTGHHGPMLLTERDGRLENSCITGLGHSTRDLGVCRAEGKKGEQQGADSKLPLRIRCADTILHGLRGG